jgi:hypothetical protein
LLPPVAVFSVADRAVTAQQQTFIVCLIVILFSYPGRVLGLDALRESKAGR